MGKLDSIQYASKTVIRPLVMNNSTTILGMLPLLLELGEGSEFQSPLAVVVVSGLISTSLLTLFVVPVLFFYFTKNQEMKMHD
jgi:multidrug efflux pump subunit AcrB